LEIVLVLSFSGLLISLRLSRLLLVVDGIQIASKEITVFMNQEEPGLELSIRN